MKFAISKRLLASGIAASGRMPLYPGKCHTYRTTLRGTTNSFIFTMSEKPDVISETVWQSLTFEARREMAAIAKRIPAPLPIPDQVPL